MRPGWYWIFFRPWRMTCSRLIIVANNHPLLYESSLVDVSDVADEIGGKQGGWYDYAKSNCLAGGHWVGVPYFIISWAVTYREDWLREAGFEYPKTWDDFRKVGRAMKAKGRPCYNSCVMKYSKHRKVAKDFVRYYMDRAQYDKYFETMDTFGIPGTKVYREHPMWKKDAKTAVFPETLQYARQVGYAGPAGRKATEALSKYISVDMLSKAIQGLRAEDAVAWATGELRKIYAA